MALVEVWTLFHQQDLPHTYVFQAEGGKQP
jgi:hypothetical protein